MRTFIDKDELLCKIKDFEIINKAIQNKIESDDNMVYFIGIPHIITLISECECYELEKP